MYYPSSENKGADQLRSYCEADLRLCFRIGNNPVFSQSGSYLVHFSTLAISLLNSIGDFLESGIDEYTTNLYDWTTERDTDDTDNEDSYEESYEDEKCETEEIDYKVGQNPASEDGEGGQNTIPDDVEDIQNTMSGDVEDDQNPKSCDVDDGQNPMSSDAEVDQTPKSKSNIK